MQPVVRSGAEDCSNRSGEAVKWLTRRSLSRAAKGAACAFGCRRTFLEAPSCNAPLGRNQLWDRRTDFTLLKPTEANPDASCVTASGSETVPLKRTSSKRPETSCPSGSDCFLPVSGHILSLSGLKVRGVGMQIPPLMRGEGRHV